MGYASPNVVNRRILWEALFRIGEDIHEPWIIGGDFNATLLDTERKSEARCRKSFDREFC